MQTTEKFSKKQPNKEAMNERYKVKENAEENKEMMKNKEQQEQASSENTTIDTVTIDSFEEEIESTIPTEQQESQTEKNQDEDAASHAAPPSNPANQMLEEAKADLFEGASFPAAKASRTRVKNSVLQVINHKDGKRIVFSKDIENKLLLQKGDTVNIAVKTSQIILMKDSTSIGFIVGDKRTIYGKELVELITQEFQLDFTAKSTCHLMNVKYQNYQGQVVAIITK